MTDTYSSDYERLKLPAGELLFETGDTTESFFLLSRGEVELRRKGTEITTIGDRDRPIGVPDSVLEIPRQYSALATSDSVLKKYALPGEDFYGWLDDHPLKLTGILRNYAWLVHHFNESNERNFELFRQYRTHVELFVHPLSRLLSALKRRRNETGSTLPEKLEELLENNPFKILLKGYRGIVNATGRPSAPGLSDLDVPEVSMERLEAGETICEEGEPGEDFYVLIEGSLSVFKGKQRVGVIDETGAVFGEMSPALGNERRATVKADTAARVSTIPNERLETILSEAPEFSHKLVKIFFKRYYGAVNLNRRLQDFLGYMKSLTRDGGLNTDLKQYLKDLLSNMDRVNDNNNELEQAADEMRKWYSNHMDSIDEQVSHERLSEFSSADITY